jgi:hypothetical protein
MHNAQRFIVVCLLALGVLGSMSGGALRAADVKVTDPTSVVMIVNRDSNEIAFMTSRAKSSGRPSWATTSILTW